MLIPCLPTSPADLLLERLDELGVPSELVETIDAPQLTRYLVRPTSSKTRIYDYTKMKRDQDLAFALNVPSVSIRQDGNVVSIEVPRDDRETVTLDDLPDAGYPICAPVGIGVDGLPAVLPLKDAPHCLVAGQSGGGKSSFLHALIAQLFRSHSPNQLEAVLIDPKRTEMTRWDGDKHLAAPVADDPQKAIAQLRGLIRVMDSRYLMLQEMGVRDIGEANDVLLARDQQIPYIVCVIDEYAELVMTSQKEVESLVIRLAQKGRAAGIHLIVATQYPMASILSGLLRVNLSTKIAFSVTDKTASRLILDQNGADDLLGRGDGLISVTGLEPQRFQSALVSQAEIDEIKGEWN